MSSGRQLPPALLPLTLLALLAVPVVMARVTRPCPDCRGADVGRSTFVRKVGYCRTPVAAIQCPRCGDGGKVSALQACRGTRLSPDLADLIRSEKDPYNRNVLELLDRVVRRDGLDPAKICGWSSPPSVPQGWARFERVGEEDYVVAIYYPDQRPGPLRAGLILLDLRGRVLDSLTYEGEPGQSCVQVRFPSAPLGDGSVASVIVSAEESWGLPRYSVRRGGNVIPSTAAGRRDCQRIGIAQDRFVVLSPGLARAP